MNNQVALVTGVSKGIGKSIAKKLINKGFIVHGTYNTDKKGAEELKAGSPSNVELYQTEFTDRSSTLKFLEELPDIKFDAVINNAGVIYFEDFEDFDFSEWDKTLEVNLTTPLVISQYMLPRMNNGGAVINIASVDGMMGTFASIAYAASKAGLINMTKALGNLYGMKGLRVNAVAPGWIDTDMATKASKAASSLTPLGRNGKPEEVADLVFYLLSKEASFINGTTVIIDGGYTNVDSIMMREAEGEL